MAWTEEEYLEYMWSSPMRDGEEIRRFLNDSDDEQKGEDHGTERTRKE